MRQIGQIYWEPCNFDNQRHQNTQQVKKNETYCPLGLSWKRCWPRGLLTVRLSWSHSIISVWVWSIFGPINFFSFTYTYSVFSNDSFWINVIWLPFRKQRKVRSLSFSCHPLFLLLVHFTSIKVNKLKVSLAAFVQCYAPNIDRCNLLLFSKKLLFKKTYALITEEVKCRKNFFLLTSGAR